MRIETARTVAVLVIAACPSLGWTETSCNAEDEEALRVLGKTMQSGHGPSFAARAVVQTAVGSQQIVITRGMPDPDGNYSVQIPDHSSDCGNLSHRLLLEPEHSCGVAQWYKNRIPEKKKEKKTKNKKKKKKKKDANKKEKNKENKYIKKN